MARQKMDTKREPDKCAVCGNVITGSSTLAPSLEPGGQYVIVCGFGPYSECVLKHREMVKQARQKAEPRFTVGVTHDRTEVVDPWKKKADEKGVE